MATRGRRPKPPPTCKWCRPIATATHHVTAPKTRATSTRLSAWQSEWLPAYGAYVCERHLDKAMEEVAEYPRHKVKLIASDTLF